MNKTLIRLLFVFLAMALLGQTNKTSVAVYPIKAVGGVDKSLAQTLASLMTNELGKSSKLIVIDESMLEEVMKRQAMNISDLCDSTVCQVKIGELVQAQKMVVAELSKLGSRYILTFKVIDIRTSAMEFSGREDCTCAEDQLDQLVAMAAIKLRQHFGETGLMSQTEMSVPPGEEKSGGGQETRPPNTKGGPMVFVPAGEFWMGCNEKVDKECSDDEKPYHKVFLDAFYIDKYEVTQGEYSECVKAGKRKGGCQDNTKYDGFTGERQPVVGVDWNQAKSYCEWAGKRLPTEAEWEKAARGTDGRKYPWGNQFDGTKLNFCDKNCEPSWAEKRVNDGYAKTAPVGSYPAGASPYGALDMAGNVWEWAADWYGANYYSSSPNKNPTGSSSGADRVLRGGCWFLNARSALASDRRGSVPANENATGGFRCSGD